MPQTSWYDASLDCFTKEVRNTPRARCDKISSSRGAKRRGDLNIMSHTNNIVALIHSVRLTGGLRAHHNFPTKGKRCSQPRTKKIDFVRIFILACLKSLWYNTRNYIALAALLSREVEGPALRNLGNQPSVWCQFRQTIWKMRGYSIPSGMPLTCRGILFT